MRALLARGAAVQQLDALPGTIALEAVFPRDGGGPRDAAWLRELVQAAPPDSNALGRAVGASRAPAVVHAVDGAGDALALALVAAGARNEAVGGGNTPLHDLLARRDPADVVGTAVALYALDARRLAPAAELDADARFALFGELADFELSVLIEPIVRRDVAALRRVLASERGRAAIDWVHTGTPFDGLNALFVACHLAACHYFDGRDGVEIVRALLDAGANPAPPRIDNGESSIDDDDDGEYAAERREHLANSEHSALSACLGWWVADMEIIELVLARDLSLESLLEALCEIPRSKKAKDLFPLFPKVLARIPDGYFSRAPGDPHEFPPLSSFVLSALYDCEKEYTTKALQYIFERKDATVDVPDGALPPLYAAAYVKSGAAMDFLLSKGANLNARFDHGKLNVDGAYEQCTAFHVAAIEGNFFFRVCLIFYLHLVVFVNNNR